MCVCVSHTHIVDCPILILGNVFLACDYLRKFTDLALDDIRRDFTVSRWLIAQDFINCPSVS